MNGVVRVKGYVRLRKQQRSCTVLGMEVANEPNFMNICEGIVLEFEVCRFDDAM